jgi:prevent-host-death family protein
MIWKLADAQDKFSEVVRLALGGKPQHVERRGDAVVVVDAEEFDRLKGEKPSLVEFLIQGPDWSELDLERVRTPMRDLDP